MTPPIFKSNLNRTNYQLIPRMPVETNNRPIERMTTFHGKFTKIARRKVMFARVGYSHLVSTND